MSSGFSFSLHNQMDAVLGLTPEFMLISVLPTKTPTDRERGRLVSPHING